MLTAPPTVARSTTTPDFVSGQRDTSRRRAFEHLWRIASDLRLCRRGVVGSRHLATSRSASPPNIARGDGTPSFLSTLLGDTALRASSEGTS